jgi:ABC-type phosphate/phosphonate transport system substrate-binding protein
MADVSGTTLMVAIQALDTVRRDTVEARHDMDDNDRADLDELLLSYDQAARELQRAYEVARKAAANLPPYERLIRRIVWKE